MDEQKQRYSANPTVTRIAAGGGYDEWFDCRERITYGDFTEASRGKTGMDALFAIASRVVVDWSLVGADGAKLLITPEQIAALDIELMEPVIDWLNARPFFVRMSRRQNPKS